MQRAHELEPAGAAEPTAHGSHVLTFAAPSVLLNVPATQSTQAVASASAYLPTPHCVQDVELASEYSPAAHASHEEAPVATPVE